MSPSPHDARADRPGQAFLRLWAMFVKEFIQLRRDRPTFAMIIGIPLIQLLLFGYAINTDPKHLPTALLSQDDSPIARAIVAAFRTTDYFDIRQEASGETEALALIRSNRAQFVIQIPPDFSRRLIHGERPALALIADATDPVAASGAIAAALGAAAGRHMVAVSTNLPAVEAFGMDPANAFGFWDWVGGRFSVSSAVGVLPLALHYGFSTVEAFLGGVRGVGAEFGSAPLDRNLPVLMGLLNVWNATFLGRAACALLPYSQALSKFAPHVQQLSMESNGKGVGLDGRPLAFAAGEIDFGEPGTNGQHSFYQLLHQGRVVPAEFIGVAAAQQDAYLPGEPVSSHEELMCHFFAQPDALAVGQTGEELRAGGPPEALVAPQTFQGARQGKGRAAWRPPRFPRRPRLCLNSPRLT